MAVTRDNIAAYLSTQFSSLAAAVGQSASDDGETGYGPDIDGALRKLGTAEADLATATVADGLRDDVFALASFYAARRFWRLLGDRVNVKVDNSQYDYRYILGNAKTMMDAAAEECAALGYGVGGKSSRTVSFHVY